jgi:carbonic anhydrase/acetyltransferase-like protein (isoleucine patch superfamily)
MEVTRYSERLVPSTRFVTYNGVSPTAPLTFIAPSSTLVGDVTIGKGSSVWYGSVIRGDVNPVKVGSNTHILENCVVHVAKIQGDFPSNIGSNVVIGAGSIIHAATLGSNITIGSRCLVLDGAVVEDGAVLLPGTVAGPGSICKSGTVYSGVPAAEVGPVGPSHPSSHAASCNHYSGMAGLHSSECGKDAPTVARDEVVRVDKLHRDPKYFQPDYSGEPIKDTDDVLGMGTPGRIFNNSLRSPELRGKEKE